MGFFVCFIIIAFLNWKWGKRVGLKEVWGGGETYNIFIIANVAKTIACKISDIVYVPCVSHYDKSITNNNTQNRVEHTSYEIVIYH